MTLTVSTGAGGAAAANAMASDNWPDSLKEYVAKCFNKCHNEIDKDQVEIILKGKITKAASDGVLHTKVPYYNLVSPWGNLVSPPLTAFT